jgi:hypothetical protein
MLLCVLSVSQVNIVPIPNLAVLDDDQVTERFMAKHEEHGSDLLVDPEIHRRLQMKRARMSQLQNDGNQRSCTIMVRACTKPTALNRPLSSPIVESENETCSQEEDVNGADDQDRIGIGSSDVDRFDAPPSPHLSPSMRVAVNSGDARRKSVSGAASRTPVMGSVAASKQQHPSISQSVSAASDFGVLLSNETGGTDSSTDDDDSGMHSPEMLEYDEAVDRVVQKMKRREKRRQRIEEANHELTALSCSNNLRHHRTQVHPPKDRSESRSSASSSPYSTELRHNTPLTARSHAHLTDTRNTTRHVAVPRSHTQRPSRASDPRAE